MRELVIFGRRRGSTQKVLVSGPEVPPAQQRAIFKDFLLTREHAEFELVELAWLDVDRSRKLTKPSATSIVFEPNAPGGTSPEQTPEEPSGVQQSQPVSTAGETQPSESPAPAADAPSPKRSSRRRS